MHCLPCKPNKTRLLLQPKSSHSEFFLPQVPLLLKSELARANRPPCSCAFCRRDVPVLATPPAGAVRVGPGADPRDRALRVAGHGQAHLPAEGPGAPLWPRRPQGQRRRLASPAQAHRPRVLHGKGQGKEDYGRRLSCHPIPIDRRPYVFTCSIRWVRAPRRAWWS
jgi:hypothetical protein